MKRILLTLTVLGVVSVAFASSALQRQFEADMRKIDMCLKNRDIDGFEKLTRAMVTKDYKHVEHGQSMNYDQMIAEMRQGVGSMTKITTAKSKFLTFKQTGNKVVAKQSHTMIGNMIGPDKKSHVMSFTGVSTNTYRKEGGKWKMAIMAWSNQKMMMDGKPFDPSKMGG